MDELNLNLLPRLRAWVDGVELAAESTGSRQERKPRREKNDQSLTTIEEYRRDRRINQAVGALFCLFLMLMLSACVLELPAFGRGDNPANNEVARRYIERGLEETGAANLVAGMILSYRVFDTFGESCVLFLAATCVTILLRRDKKNTTAQDLREMAREERQDRKDKDTILRTSVLLLLPVSVMVGFYVMLFGHLSPGGGFSGGAILGGGMILYARTFGTDHVRKFFNEHIYHLVKVVCLMGYAAMLCYYVLTGASGLDNYIPLGVPGRILSGGMIMPINLLVGFEVTCTIYAFYALFSEGEV
ncbi:MAG: hypothetical protein IJD21_05680 [Oscillospiraceae bacterium]|nr:hypothetical protein [Oscillospiraceae bacterium]